MREILFRGKRRDTGEWSYGSLQCFKGYSIFDTIWKNFITVNSKTVGQYTGLKDKNDTMIFEGDIVKTVEGPFKVVCEHGAFWLYDELLLSNDHLDFLGAYKTEAIEVIGNIYDNPELLEVAK